MQKFLNQPERAVAEMIEGVLALDPELQLLDPYYVLTRSRLADLCDRQVTLVSGGGSGHEPAHAGYIGAGMLTAVVAGEIFTSPSADSVWAAIQAVGGRHGVLLIVKNYTGDRLNFGVAAEMARAEGLLVETVIVADDVSLPDSDDNAGRRGLAGTVLIHKIAGAAAAEGKDLPQVASAAQAAADNLATMGVSLSSGTSFLSGKPGIPLDGQVEIGLGIHGEPGVRRQSILPADQLLDLILDRIVRSLSLRPGEQVAVLVNNLGATTHLELAIAARHTLSHLSSRGLRVERIYSGTFLSSLDMAGLSVSVLRLNPERLRWLDAQTAAPAWPNAPKAAPKPISERTIALDTPPEVVMAQPPRTPSGQQTQAAVTAACEALLKAEGELTRLDELTGDGDLGRNFARAARAIQQQLGGIALDDSAAAIRALGLALQRHLGGSSGPLYGVLFLRAAASLENAAALDPGSWALAMVDGCHAMSELGGARLGDRTMLDALIPFAVTLTQKLQDGENVNAALQAASAAASTGSQHTAQSKARRGRSSYLGDRVLGTPDPGAVAAALWLQAAVSQLTQKSATD